MIAKKTSKCLDRCGLTIHAGHDEIEPGHFAWRHVDCDKAHAFAWVRDRLATGDLVSDVQIKLLSTAISPELRMAASLYVIECADQRVAA